MGTDIESSVLSNSLRMDWLAVTYRPPNAREMDSILEYVLNICRFVSDGRRMEQGAGRRFFAESVACRDAGILVRWTPFGGKINEGCVAIDLQGDFFELTDLNERKAILLDLAELPGFNNCTRADYQRTIKNPEVNSEELYDLVRKRMIWLPGHNKYQAGSHLDSAGNPVDGASTMWGSAQSTIRCTSYNKAAEQGQPELNVVRHEVRTRKEAAHGYFCATIQALRKEADEVQTTAEQLIARSAIAKHMTYLDTSRLSHLQDKKDWPKNWVRDSEPAGFMTEVINGHVTDVKRAYKGRQDLEARHSHFLRQYGRTEALRLLVARFRHGQSLPEALMELFDQCMVRLKDEDLDELKSLLGDVIPEDLVQKFRDFRAEAAEHLEHHEIPHGL